MSEEIRKVVEEMAREGVDPVDAAYMQGVADHIRFSRKPDELEEVSSDD